MKILFVSLEVAPFVNAIKEIGHDIRVFEPRCEAVIPFIKEIDWQPNIIHCYGWQAAPAVAFIKQQRETDPAFQRTAIVFTVDDGSAQPDLIKSGLESADVVSAVFNGVDYDIWNPAKDSMIVRRYNKNTLSLKAINKTALQKQAGLAVDESVPLLAVRSCSDERLTEIESLGCQIIVLDRKNSNSEIINLVFAGADMFLFAANDKSAYMDQLIAYKYGTLPIKFDQNDLTAIKKAVEGFKNKTIWQSRQQEIMLYDYSWSASAKKYISLYVKAIDKVLT